MPKQLKNRKVTLASVEYVIDDWGYQHPRMVEKARPWAYYRHMSADERVEGGLMTVSDDYVYFDVADPHLDDLASLGYYVITGGKVYDVTAVDDYEGLPDHTIRLTCKYDERQTEEYLESLESLGVER